MADTLLLFCVIHWIHLLHHANRSVRLQCKAYLDQFRSLAYAKDAHIVQAPSAEYSGSSSLV